MTLCKDNGENFFQALNRVMMNEADNEAAQRNKRTIGILRELFPEISQVSRCRTKRSEILQTARTRYPSYTRYIGRPVYPRSGVGFRRRKQDAGRPISFKSPLSRRLTG